MDEKKLTRNAASTALTSTIAVKKALPRESLDFQGNQTSGGIVKPDHSGLLTNRKVSFKKSYKIAKNCVSCV